MHRQVLLAEGIGTHRHIERYSDLSFDQISEEITALIAHFEQRFSRFDPNSMLSLLNKKRKILTQDSDFFQMLELGREAHKLSDGAFSLFVASDLEALGYGRGELATHGSEESSSEDLVPEIILDRAKGEIILRGEKRIDLGGLGKGYLIGLIKSLLLSHHISVFRINGGGDIYIQQEHFEQLGSIVLQNPLNIQESIGRVALLKGACCGSGLSFCHREYQGKQYHHLIDPKTGKPVETVVVGVYVLHEQIEIADMLATILFVAPIASVEEIARRFGGEYLLIFDDLSCIHSPGFVFST